MRDRNRKLAVSGSHCSLSPSYARDGVNGWPSTTAWRRLGRDATIEGRTVCFLQAGGDSFLDGRFLGSRRVKGAALVKTSQTPRKPILKGCRKCFLVASICDDVRPPPQPVMQRARSPAAVTVPRVF